MKPTPCQFDKKMCELLFKNSQPKKILNDLHPGLIVVEFNF